MELFGDVLIGGDNRCDGRGNAGEVQHGREREEVWCGRDNIAHADVDYELVLDTSANKDLNRVPIGGDRTVTFDGSRSFDLVLEEVATIVFGSRDEYVVHIRAIAEGEIEIPSKASDLAKAKVHRDAALNGPPMWMRLDEPVQQAAEGNDLGESLCFCRHAGARLTTESIPE
jgi:hypothetical protein